MEPGCLKVMVHFAVSSFAERAKCSSDSGVKINEWDMVATFVVAVSS